MSNQVLKRVKKLLPAGEGQLMILIVFTIVLLSLLGITLKGKIYSSNNLSSMAFQVSEFAILSLGMSAVMLLGGIDLSIIANANLSAILAGFILTGKAFNIESMPEGLLILLAVLCAVVCSTLLGCFNGFLISRISVPPLVATLGTMTFYNGVGMAITSGKGVVGFPKTFTMIGTTLILKIPLIFIIFLIVAAIYIYIMEKTTFGKKIYFIGENHTAGRFAGVKNEKIIMRAYAIAGFMAGVASLIIMTRVNSAKVGYGDTYLLQAMLVVVLGGISPSGGKGKIFGVILAIVNLQFLQSAFTVLQVTPYVKNLVWGSILILVMSLNKINNDRKLRVTRSKE